MALKPDAAVIVQPLRLATIVPGLTALRAIGFRAWGRWGFRV